MSTDPGLPQPWDGLDPGDVVLLPSTPEDEQPTEDHSWPED